MSSGYVVREELSTTLPPFPFFGSLCTYDYEIYVFIQIYRFFMTKNSQGLSAYDLGDIRCVGGVTREEANPLVF